MSSVMKTLLVGVVTLLVLAVSALSIYLLRNNGQTSRKTLVLESTIEGIDIVPDNMNLALDYLQTNGFWNSEAVYNYANTTKKLTAKEIRFTLADSIAEPFYIQEDQEGNMVLSTSVKVNKDGIVDITVALGDFFDDVDNLEKTVWIAPQFWRAISLISKVPANNDLEFFKIINK